MVNMSLHYPLVNIEASTETLRGLIFLREPTMEKEVRVPRIEPRGGASSREGRACKGHGEGRIGGLRGRTTRSLRSGKLMMQRVPGRGVLTLVPLEGVLRDSDKRMVPENGCGWKPTCRGERRKWLPVLFSPLPKKTG